MSKTYCKWPVIAAIIIGSLIVLSLLYCLARCVCCGAECCCGCLSCCNACCPSGSRNKNSGYQQPPGPPPQPYGPYGQYQSPVPPAYNPGFAYNHGPQTATFDAPSKSMNEDALPAMPSWDNARSRRVEQEHLPQYEGGEGDIVEMDKFDNRPGATQQHLLAHEPAHDSTLEHGVGGDDQYYHHDDYHNGENHTGYDYSQGYANEYDNHRQHPMSTSPVYDTQEQYSAHSQPHGYNSTQAPTFDNYNTDPVMRGPYASPPPPVADNWAQNAGPPSYHTGPPSLLSPGGSGQRKPVNGSWRNL